MTIDPRNQALLMGPPPQAAGPEMGPGAGPPPPGGAPQGDPILDAGGAMLQAYQENPTPESRSKVIAVIGMAGQMVGISGGEQGGPASPQGPTQGPPQAPMA